MSSAAEPFRQWQQDGLRVAVYRDREGLGQAAAAEASAVLQAALEQQGSARVILASAASQVELLAGLRATSLDWSRVTIFHMDEYPGAGPEDPRSFRRFLREHFLTGLPAASLQELKGEATDLNAECARYEKLLRAAPIDLVCLGIGENGHLAFNDPAVADFTERRWVKLLALDDQCRQQQVHDGCFAKLAEVPHFGLSLTIPALISGRRIVGAIPGSRKAPAIRQTLLGPISEDCPASILRRHKAVSLYLDSASASLLS